MHGRGRIGRYLRRIPKLPLDLSADLVDEPDSARLSLRLDRGGHGVEKRGTSSGRNRP